MTACVYQVFATHSPKPLKLHIHACHHPGVAGHPARHLTPQRLNEILQAAELGDLTAQHELFRDMEERDAHLFAEISKRKRAVIRLSWDVVPPRNANKNEEDAAAFIKELLLDLPDFEDLLFDLLDGVGHGFAAIELEWQRVNSKWTIGQAHHRPQSWFQLDQATRSALRLRDHSAEGQLLQPFGWLLHIHKAISGYTVRSGLTRVLVWPYLFKHFAVGDLAEFLDIYGLPLRIGKFPTGASDEEKSTLWKAVAGIGHNAAGIIPANMALEFQEDSKGTEKPFEAMIRWAERSQSKAILGATLTGDAGSTGLGSGLAEVHNEVRQDIRDSDCKQLAGTLTRQLIYPLLAINKGWSDARRCPRFVFDTLEAEDLQTFADSLPKLVQIGMQIPAGWVHERLRIPVAEKGEPVLAERVALLSTDQAQPIASTALAQNAIDTNPSVGFTDQDVLDGAMADLESGLQSQVQLWLQPVLDILQQAGGTEAALDFLARQDALTNDGLLSDSIAKAMFVAELFGAHGVVADLQE